MAGGGSHCCVLFPGHPELCVQTSYPRPPTQAGLAGTQVTRPKAHAFRPCISGGPSLRSPRALGFCHQPGWHSRTCNTASPTVSSSTGLSCRPSRQGGLCEPGLVETLQTLRGGSPQGPVTGNVPPSLWKSLWTARTHRLCVVSASRPLFA